MESDSTPDRQKRRMRVLRLAIGATAATMAITLSVVWAGYMPYRAAAIYIGSVVLAALLFFVLMKSGVNQSFKDPSMTAAQMAAAGILVSYAAYEGADAQPAFMVMYLFAYIFGVFVMSVRGLVWLAVFFVACYAGVAGLSLLWRPETTDAKREVFRIVAFAFSLGWFAIIGAYVAQLRRNLRNADLQLREALYAAEELAGRDALTGCLNRRRIHELLDLELMRARRGAPFAACMVDIDHFKAVNDRHGHAAGDDVLRQFAQTAGSALRPTDFFARYGGEEFVAVLPQMTLDATRVVAERLRSAVEATRFTGLPEEFRATISIGVAEYCPGETVEQTLARADAALYRAKRDGRNRVVCAGSENGG